MTSKSNHAVIELGIWTLVTNKSQLFIFVWLSGLRSLIGRLWRILCNGLGIPELIEDPLRKNKKEGDAGSNVNAQMIVQFVRFVKEVYALGPSYFSFGMIMGVWEMAEGSLRLYFSSRVLSAISHCLATRQSEPLPIIRALALRLALSVLSEYLGKIGAESDAILGERVKYHFLQKAMHASLEFDLLTSEDPEVRNKLESNGRHLIYHRSDAWEAFTGFKKTIFKFLAILSELFLMFKLSRTSSTFALSTAFCFVDPIMNTMNWSLFSRSFVAFCNNSSFARMASLHNLAFDDTFREDRLCNNLGRYIVREFENSKTALGDVNTEHIYSQWYRQQPIYSKVLSDLAWDFSLMFFALRVLWDHTTITMEELILVQQASSTVQSSSYRLVHHIEKLSEHLRTVRSIYSLDQIQNKIKDGQVSYPSRSEKGHGGAEVEFRNVSFKYPGTDKDALTNLSFVIKPGQLVVIVGVNGSGKSSTIKLLARLYDPSGGEVLIDGLPLAKYKLEQVRGAMTILRQDHPVLPVSLRENIALGLPERTATRDEIEEAIRLGGAEKFVLKLKQGHDTVLNPVKTAHTHFTGETDTALKSIVEEKEKKTDLSGGESQRLSASRTFLRLMGGNIRLVVADEPTSALDPGGEYELFSRLREHKHGKTVIFITHRFGHLTKYADLILCLKDGHLVEQGTHENLLAMNGEYKRLYDIQANAFVSSE